MSGFTKLFSSIVASSIWCEDDKTRIVWVTMLAMANRQGIVEAAVPGLANAARVSVDDCRKALQKFESPDPDSRSKQHEGRRIEVIDGGFRLLNYESYRHKLSADERREYKAAKQAEYRRKKSRRKVDATAGEAAYCRAAENGASERILNSMVTESLPEHLQ